MKELEVKHTTYSFTTPSYNDRGTCQVVKLTSVFRFALQTVTSNLVEGHVSFYKKKTVILFIYLVI